MVITLNPHSEALLRSVAAQRGLPPEEAIDLVLSEASHEFQEAAAGIQRGMNDYAAGRWISLEDYEAQVRQETPHAKEGPV